MRESWLRVMPAATSSRERTVPARRRSVWMRRSVEVMPALFHSFGSCAQVPREWNGAPNFTVLHAGENRGFNQFCLMFQFLHGDLRFSRAWAGSFLPLFFFFFPFSPPTL